MNTIYGRLGGASAVNTTDRELMQQALEALEKIADEIFSPYDNKLGDVILALRDRLAQPEQEPVAWTLLLVGEHHGLVGKAGEKCPVLSCSHNGRA